MDNCDNCQRSFGENVLYQAQTGKEAACEHIYVFPKPEPKMIHKQFMKRVSGGQYGILLVDGRVGAGKSSYLQYLKSQIKNHNLLLSEILIADVKEVGRKGYIPASIIEGLKFSDHGWEGFLDRIRKDQKFRKKIANTMQKFETELDFECRPLAVAFTALSSDDKKMRKGASNWMRGIPPPPGADKEKAMLRSLRAEGMPTRDRSVRTVSVKEVLYFLRTLSLRLGYQGFMVLVDEVEKASGLSKSKGRIFLSSLRDLINILLEAPDGTIASQKGLFVAFAISTEYLGYSGVIDSGMAYEEKGRLLVKLKTLLSDSPRLSTVLSSMTQRINAEVVDSQVHIKIGLGFAKCYAKTNGTAPRDRTFIEQILHEVEEEPLFTTRSFVTAVMRKLSMSS